MEINADVAVEPHRTHSIVRFRFKFEDGCAANEDAIKVGGGTKAPDYGFRIGGARKFFVEAKNPRLTLRGPAPSTSPTQPTLCATTDGLHSSSGYAFKLSSNSSAKAIARAIASPTASA